MLGEIVPKYLLAATELKQLITTSDLTQLLPDFVSPDFLIWSIEQHSWVFEGLPDSVGTATIMNSTIYQ